MAHCVVTMNRTFVPTWQHAPLLYKNNHCCCYLQQHRVCLTMSSFHYGGGGEKQKPQSIHIRQHGVMSLNAFQRRKGSLFYNFSSYNCSRNEPCYSFRSGKCCVSSRHPKVAFPKSCKGYITFNYERVVVRAIIFSLSNLEKRRQKRQRLPTLAVSFSAICELVRCNSRIMEQCTGVTIHSGMAPFPRCVALLNFRGTRKLLVHERTYIEKSNISIFLTDEAVNEMIHQIFLVLRFFEFTEMHPPRLYPALLPNEIKTSKLFSLLLIISRHETSAFFFSRKPRRRFRFIFCLINNLLAWEWGREGEINWFQRTFQSSGSLRGSFRVVRCFCWDENNATSLWTKSQINKTQSVVVQW